MKHPRIKWFWVTIITLMCAATGMFPSLAEADWTYKYSDDFSTDKSEQDSYFHSIFWPEGAFPPLEPYLYYLDTQTQRELALGDYNSQPAHLGYCFPIGQAPPNATVRGNLYIDVQFRYSAEVVSSLSGYLLYRFSPDGVNWSNYEELKIGSNNIPIESSRGTCYIIFFGTEVLIDNLVVRLDSSPATLQVPRDFATIQAAIDSASDGDIIEVAPGTYSGNGNWDIDFQGKAITVRSTNGPEQTIINCAGRNHRGFYFHRKEGADSVLRGFTIIAAQVTGSVIPPDNESWTSSSAHPIGGGIYCESSNPSIIDCVIKQCAAELGGGIGCVDSAPMLIDCTIEQCDAGGLGPAESGGYGAGIGLIRDSDPNIINCIIKNNVGYHNSKGSGVYCRQSSAMLANCDISFNSAQGNIEGGGIYCGGTSSEVMLENCIISNNTAETGSAIFTTSSTDTFNAMAGSDNSGVEMESQVPICRVNITNCTITNNKLPGSQASSSNGGVIHSISSDITIRNSIVWYNEGTAISLIGPALNNPVLYSNIEGGYPGQQSNIDTPPLFASAAGDYHLKSFLGRYEPPPLLPSQEGAGEWVMDNEHSPCIDAGDPKDPIGPELRPNGKRINMGAYGGTLEASKSLGPLIFHVDGTNGNDFNDGLGRENAFRTIQRAVDETIDGDIVLVWPGIYREEVTFDNKAITLQSADHAATVIAPSGYAFSFFGAESSNSILRNFVITNCGEGAVFCQSASPMLTNLTIVKNEFAVAAYGGANPIITNSILWDNRSGDLFQSSVRYSCLERLDDVLQGEGNIDTNPSFADSENGDFHLQSRYGRYSPSDGTWIIDTLTSPCIDAGDPSVYFGRERMPHGGRVNMGAYGGTPFASKSGWPPF